MKFGYTTLACPNWTLEEMFERGAALGYHGLELGWLEGDFPTPSLVQAHLPRLQSLSGASGCRLMSIGSMVQLAWDEPAQRAAALDEARALLELGGELGVDFLRVFAGWQAQHPSPEWTLNIVSESLEQLADTAAQTGVKLALETHDVFNSSDNVRHVLDRLASPHVVALWDLLHPCRVGQTPQDVWANLAGRIGYIHVKDAYRNGSAGGWTLVSPIGTGEVPVREALQTLKDGGFDGYYVVEVEKRNHAAELPEPEESLPLELARLKEFLGVAA